MSLHDHACDNCDAPVAVVFCQDCHMYLCDSNENECSSNIHAPRSKRAHRRRDLTQGAHSKAVIEVYVGASNLPHLPTFTHTDPLITLSTGKTPRGPWEYLDRTELQRDEHHPYFAKKFVLDYPSEGKTDAESAAKDEIYLQLACYDGDLDHHTHRAFHFPEEKDLIGTSVIRLKDVLITEDGQQVQGFVPHHERDQNRFFYSVTNTEHAEIEESLREYQTQIWIEAHVVSEETYELEKSLHRDTSHKILDGLHQSAADVAAIQQQIASRSSKTSSKAISKTVTPPKLSKQASRTKDPVTGTGLGDAGRRLSVPEEAAEKLLHQHLETDGSLKLTSSRLVDDVSAAADAEEDVRMTAAGLVHYLPNEHRFFPDPTLGSTSSDELNSTIKHLMGRIQNLEWAQKSMKHKIAPSGDGGVVASSPRTVVNGVDSKVTDKLVSNYESLLISNHQLTLQLNDLRKVVEAQSLLLRAQPPVNGFATPPGTASGVRRPVNTITPRPYTTASPTANWYVK